MYQIKFGTDGWRGIIVAEFTVENIKRVTDHPGQRKHIS